jgi:hypothetical protein
MIEANIRLHAPLMVRFTLLESPEDIFIDARVEFSTQIHVSAKLLDRGIVSDTTCKISGNR